MRCPGNYFRKKSKFRLLVNQRDVFIWRAKHLFGRFGHLYSSGMNKCVTCLTHRYKLHILEQVMAQTGMLFCEKHADFPLRSFVDMGAQLVLHIYYRTTDPNNFLFLLISNSFYHPLHTFQNRRGFSLDLTETLFSATNSTMRFIAPFSYAISIDLHYKGHGN